MMTLDGRVALVTRRGARDRPGHLARSRRRRRRRSRSTTAATRPPASATVQEIGAAGGRAAAFCASIDGTRTTSEMVAAVAATLGPVDLLVNNAGVASRGQTVADTDPAEAERLWRTHVFGAWALSKLVVPAMRERRAGRHRDDLQRRDAAHGGELRAVQHGEGCARGARA